MAISPKLTSILEHLSQIARAFPLPWTHYVRLLRVRNAFAQEFYIREALAGGWSVRQLDRQINSQLRVARAPGGARRLSRKPRR